MTDSLSPVLGGEGWGEGEINPADTKYLPLSLTLSPEYRGEGTRASHVFNAA